MSVVSGELGSEGHVITQAGQMCAASDCLGDDPTIGAGGAYLHTSRDTGKLLILCPACSLHVRLHNSLRFPLVAL